MRPFLMAGTFLLLAGSSLAQTKLIAHKSHSGTVESFRLAYEMDFPDLGNSDFGMAPERTVRNASLDSLIFISDSAAVMITSEYCVSSRVRKERAPKKWRAGRDTVSNHPLFIRKNSISFIKQQLQRGYYFQNPVDSIVFVYVQDQEENHQTEYQALPAAGGGGNGPSSQPPLVWMALILLFSVAIASMVYLGSRSQRLIGSART